MFGRKKATWVFGGSYCSAHLSHAVKVYGTAKVMAADPESIKTDDRCFIEGCKGFIEFIVHQVSDND